MKRLLLFLIALPVFGQVSNPSIVLVGLAPSGSCTANLPDEQVVTLGTLYSCQNGTWTQITGGGGSVTPGGSNQQIQFNNNSSFGGAAQATYNTSTNVLAAKLSANSGVIQNRADMVDIYSDLGCDPTGTTECTALYSVSAPVTVHVTNPNGASGSTYLVANTANQSLPAGVNLQFDNGAQLKTGSQASATIGTIQRVGSYQGTSPISVAGCTSTVSVAGTEVFSACPASITFGAGEIVILTGLTHAANCYQGCYVTVASSGTGFTVSNPAATTVTAGTETGTATQQSGDTFLNLTALGATSSSAVSPGVITITATNTLPALPAVVVLVSTTNVRAGTYTLIPSSVSSSSFQLWCPTGCTSKSTASEVGTAREYAGGLTYAHFSGALTGVPANGFTTPLNAVSGVNGSAQLICSGTTNYNGPYWITAVADSQDIGLLDTRMSAAQETAGSCFIPYTFTVNGSVIAQPFQRLVADNSGVVFQGSKDVYVGWYGAQGAAVSTNDWFPIQEALYWAPGKHVYAPNITHSISGTNVVNFPISYKVSDSLQMYGNMQEFDGELTGQKSGGTMIQCNGTGPCVITSPAIVSPFIHGLSFSGSTCGANSAAGYIVQPIATVEANDGWFSGASSSKGEQLFERCFQRDGIHFISGGGGFNQDIYSRSIIDYWRVDSLAAVDNKGYGFSCWGTDCNNGNQGGASDYFGNTYGGIADFGQTSSTYTGFGSESNNASFAVGASQTITGLTVSGSGATASCTGTLSSTLPAGFVVGAWVIVAGTDGSGGAANTDTNGTLPANYAAPLTAINSGSHTFTYGCPGATGGPATTGTAQTADSNTLELAIQVYPSGFSPNGWQFTGAYGGIPNMINPYAEITNGCNTSNGMTWGGNDYSLNTAVDCNSSNAAIAGNFTGVQLVNQGTNLDVTASVLKVQSQFSTPTVANSILELQSGSSASPLTGSTEEVKFLNGTTAEYQLGEATLREFILQDLQDTGNPFIMFLEPGTLLDINAPTSTTPIQLQAAGGWTGNVTFFNATAADKTTISTTGILSPSFSTLSSGTGGLNLAGTASPVTLNGSVGTAGQVLTSAGAGATPTWGSGGGGSSGLPACADTSGSGTAQSCTTTPTFVPAINNCIAYTTTTANTGALTLNVNSSSAAAVQKWLGTALATGDISANSSETLCYDGTHWQAMTIGNAPSGTGTVTTSGSPTTGFVPKFTGSTAIGNSNVDDGITTANVLTVADTAGIAAVGGVNATNASMSPTVGGIQLASNYRFYESGGAISMAVGSTTFPQYEFISGGLRQASAGYYCFSSSSTNAAGCDTSFFRSSAGTVEVSNAATANALGTISAAVHNIGAAGTLGTAVFGNATSGLITVEAPTGALTSVAVLLPDVAGTLALTSQLDLSISPVALPTSSIGANTCTAATGSPFTATGVTTSMVVVPGFASDPSAVTGYGSSGGLSVNAYPAANAVNVKVCNSTASPITPGALTVNIRIIQ